MSNLDVTDPEVVAFAGVIQAAPMADAVKLEAAASMPSNQANFDANLVPEHKVAAPEGPAPSTAPEFN